MLSVYLFCLVVGGGFAILSAFGDLFGTASEADPGDDPDAGAGAEVDGRSDDVSGGAEWPIRVDVGRAAAIFSLRSLVYSLFGFGATGATLTWLGAGPGAPLTLLFAVMSGLLVGGALGALLSLLKQSDTGRAEQFETEETNRQEAR